MRRVVAGILSLVLVMTFVAGCTRFTGAKEDKSMERAEMARKLLSLGSEADAKKTALTISEQIRTRISAQIPGARWTGGDEAGSGRSCRVRVPSYASSLDTTLASVEGVQWTEENWKLVAGIAEEVGAQYGATRVDGSLTRPGDYDLLLSSEDPFGVRIHLGAAVNLTLSVSGGCRVLEHRKAQAEKDAQ